MRRQRYLNAALGGVTILALLFAAGGRSATAQVLQQSIQPLVIHDIVGPDTVRVGEIGTYRVKVNDPRDVEYRWKARDYTALGNPVVHRFERPGTVDVEVTARNVRGAVTKTFTITILGPEPDRPAQPALAGATEPGGDAAEKDSGSSTPPGGVTATEPAKSADSGEAAAAATAIDESTMDSFRGGSKVSDESEGYTWIVATYFQRPSAVALANSYRASGYRTGVITDNSGQGSQVYRVILGEFKSEASALRAKRHLVNAGYQNVLLHELGSSRG